MWNTLWSLAYNTFFLPFFFGEEISVEVFGLHSFLPTRLRRFPFPIGTNVVVLAGMRNMNN